jgi:DNA-nicking Smr family endonuclease
MAKPRKHEPENDAAAFREAVKDVTPLPASDRVTLTRAPRPPTPVQRMEDERQALKDSLSAEESPELDLESGDVLRYLREGVAPQVLRKLRAGQWAVQDELDLHGLRSEEARMLLGEFLTSAYKRGLRCLRVIHGKGYGSPGGEPVLKKRIGAWMTQRGEVMAFCEARPAEGGSGAVMVLLGARGARHAAREDDEDA